MKSEKIKRLVAFAVLMESGNGVLVKSPSYVVEKFELTLGDARMPIDLLINLLDMGNKAKYERYLKVWKLDE